MAQRKTSSKRIIKDKDIKSSLLYDILLKRKTEDETEGKVSLEEQSRRIYKNLEELSIILKIGGVKISSAIDNSKNKIEDVVTAKPSRKIKKITPSTDPVVVSRRKAQSVVVVDSENESPKKTRKKTSSPKLNSEPSKAGSFSKKQEVYPVAIVHVSEDIIQRIFKYRGRSGDKDTDKIEPEYSSFIKMLIPLAILGGALFKSIQSILQGNPLQGLHVLLAKAASKIGGYVLSPFKALFKEGGIGKRILNFFTNAIESIGKQIANLNISKKITAFFSTAIKNIGEQITKLFKFSASGKISKSIGFLKTFGGKIFQFLKKAPVIGTIISFASAFSRIKNNNDWLGGMIDIASGLFSLVPGLGTSLSIVLDVFNASLDIQQAKAKASGGLAMKDVIKQWFAKHSRNIPFLAPFVRLGEAIGCFLTNNNKQVFIELIGAMVSIIPGAGILYDVLFGTEEQQETAIDTITSNSVGKALTNFFTAIGDAISSLIDKVLKNIANLIPDLAWNAIKFTSVGKSLSKYRDKDEADVPTDLLEVDTGKRSALSSSISNIKSADEAKKLRTKTYEEYKKDGIDEGERALLKSLDKLILRLQEKESAATSVNTAVNNNNNSSVNVITTPSSGVSSNRTLAAYNIGLSRYGY